MKTASAAEHKIFTKEKLLQQLSIWRMKNKKIVFTNGVFDILHKGHLAALSEAASFADMLIVGVNADKSVKKLKGDSRPINDEQSRALLLASLIQTDAVIIFEEDTPLELIKAIMPDVLVKGGDYTTEQIAGAKEVMAAGGRVEISGMVPGVSTTLILSKTKQ